MVSKPKRITNKRKPEGFLLFCFLSTCSYSKALIAHFKCEGLDVELRFIYETGTEGVFHGIMGTVYSKFAEYVLTM